MKKNICFVSCCVPQTVADELSGDFTVIPLPPDPSLADPVSSHPDMILSVIENSVIMPRYYFEANRKLFDCVIDMGYSIVLSDAPRSGKYPADVGFNIAVGEGYIICRTDSTASEVLECAKKLGKDIINVKQGYAGCSCIVTDKAVLTSDMGIRSALADYGIHAAYVEKDGISLPGYDVGFIGGCGGYFDGTLYFFGSLDTALCGGRVRQFAALHGYAVRELNCERLTDYGGMKFLQLPLDKVQKK